LRLEDCTKDQFANPKDNKVALALVRLELSAFLAGRGEPVFHPSDLSRSSFMDDFLEHPDLDEEVDP
jgi:hypothetical protein